MDNYLIDRETLGKFVDELIKKKALPAHTPEELAALREDAIAKLDERIGRAVFNGFTETDYDAFNQLLDNSTATEADYDAFFADSGIDLEHNITAALTAFSQEFLGGQNV